MKWTVELFGKIRRSHIEGGTSGGFCNGERGKERV